MMRSVICLLTMVVGCSADVGNLFGGGGEGPEGGSSDNGTGGGAEDGGGPNVGGMTSSTGGAPSQGGMGSTSTAGGGGAGGSPTCDVDANDPGNVFHDIECANCLEEHCCELMVICINDQTPGAECNGNWVDVQECIEQNQQNCWLNPVFPNAPNWDQVKACKQQYCFDANCQ